MHTFLSYAESGPMLTVGSIVVGLLLLSCGPVQAQVQDSRHNLPSAQAPQRTHPHHSAPSIPGTGLPPATRPADPPSTQGPSLHPTGPRGNAQTSTPGMPGDPAQAPVDGGLGWLAAAGAAYAANRLRKQSTSDDDE